MKVMGNLLSTPGVIARLVSVIALMCATTAVAQNQLIPLRKGPGSAFPVVSEIPANHSLTPVLRQGHWLKLSDGQRTGWVHERHLVESTSVSESQLWLVRESGPLSKWQLQLGVNTEEAYQLGVLFPRQDYDLALRAERGFDAAANWYSLQLALEAPLRRYQQSSLVAGAAVGSGSAEAGSDRWNDDGETQTTALAAVNLDWQAELNRQLTFIIRLKNEQAFAGNRANDTSLALMWNLKL